MTDQPKKVDLEKKIQKIRRTKRNSAIDIIVGSVFIIVGWPLYNITIRHYIFGGVWTEHPYRWVGLASIVAGILLIVIGIIGLSYSRLQTKKYREQLRQQQ